MLCKEDPSFVRSPHTGVPIIRGYLSRLAGSLGRDLHQKPYQNPLYNLPTHSVPKKPLGCLTARKPRRRGFLLGVIGLGSGKSRLSGIVRLTLCGFEVGDNTGQGLQGFWGRGLGKQGIGFGVWG